MATTVQINGVTYSGALKGPWPEDPKRSSQRQGASLQCIPGISGGQIVAGKKIHVDIGHDVSWGGVEIILPLITETSLADILTHYHSLNPVTVTYRDARGNVWECSYDNNTTAVDFEPHPGFDDRTAHGGGLDTYKALYKVTIKLLFITKTTTGTLP